MTTQDEIVKLEGMPNVQASCSRTGDDNSVVSNEKCSAPDNTLPYIQCKSPVKAGRKVLGNIVSVIILLIALANLIMSLLYYSNPPESVSGGYINVLKEALCFLTAVLIFCSRFCRCTELPAGRLLAQHRELVSLVLGVVSCIFHFYALIRWYVQEGSVYVWESDHDLPYTLEINVKAIMSSILANFILSFVEFSLMLLTKMRPRYQDLNPHLTAFMEREKLLTTA